jgi:hypothetical protein
VKRQKVLEQSSKVNDEVHLETNPNEIAKGWDLYKVNENISLTKYEVNKKKSSASKGWKNVAGINF